MNPNNILLPFKPNAISRCYDRPKAEIELANTRLGILAFSLPPNQTNPPFERLNTVGVQYH